MTKDHPTKQVEPESPELKPDARDQKRWPLCRLRYNSPNGKPRIKVSLSAGDVPTLKRISPPRLISLKSVKWTLVPAAMVVAAINVQPVSAATPTLVQHVATGMGNNPVTTLSVAFPNPVGAGNALILGVQFASVGSIASVTDDQGNTWTAGPTAIDFSGTNVNGGAFNRTNIRAGRL
jgi:hypothetical protein